MQRYRRSDATYQHAVTWEPARPAIGSDFGECLLTGSLLAAVVILGDRAILGTWCELPAMGFVWSLCVLACWLRVRWVQRVPEPVQRIEGPQRDRLVLVNAPTPEQATDRDGDVRRSEFDLFVKGCAVDTSLRRWEPILGRDGYEEYRDILLRMGWAKWRSRDRRQGWTGPAQQCRPER